MTMQASLPSSFPSLTPALPLLPAVHGHRRSDPLRAVLRRTGDRCPGCRTRLALGGHGLTWEIDGAGGEALCLACLRTRREAWVPRHDAKSTEVAFATVDPSTPTEDVSSADDPEALWNAAEERALLGVTVGLLSGWFLGGPVGGLVGMGVGGLLALVAPRWR